MSQVALSIRPAAADDLAGIVRLQHRAYAANRALLGVEPLPLLVDYAALLDRMQSWLAFAGPNLSGVLIMDLRPDDALIWSVASDPDGQGVGVGTALMRHAEAVTLQSGQKIIRLYTGSRLTDRIAWYRRLGFDVEREEELPDRVLVHMVKRLV